MKTYTILSRAILIISLCFLFLNSNAQVLSCTAVIGSPASGTSHYIDVSWTSFGGNAYLERSSNGTNWKLIYKGTGNSYNDNTGAIGNLPWYYRASTDTTNVNGWVNATPFPIYSAANDTTPLLVSPSSSTVSISIQDVVTGPNPAYTTYAINCVSNGLYVQPDGTFADTAFYQTKAAWDVTLITGLTTGDKYCFIAIAKNHDGYITSPSGNLSPLQTFASSSSFSTATLPPTNVWCSPGTCIGGGMKWTNAFGCNGAGMVGYTSSPGTFNGCFLRSPEVNCTGIAQVTLTFDMTNTACLSQDSIYFYVWSVPDSTYYPSCVPNCGHSLVTTINGSPVSHLLLTTARNCESESVVFDLSAIPVNDRTNLLFYVATTFMETSGTALNVLFDNMSLTGSGTANEACITPGSCVPPQLVLVPGDTLLCPGSSTSLSITGLGGLPIKGLSDIKWQLPAGWSINNGQYRDSISITVGDSSGVLIVSGIDSCDDTLLYRFPLVIPAFTASSFIYGDSSVTAGSNQSYAVLYIQGITSYTWTVPTGWTINSGQGTPAINVTAGDSGGVITVTANTPCGTGITNHLSVTIATTSANCHAFFALYPDTLHPHHWFALNLTTGTAPITYTWNWGDGNYSGGDTTSHQYDSAGVYTICLSITDGVGCTSTYCDSALIYRTNGSNQIVYVNVITSIPTAVQQVESQSNLHIYPNPSSDMVTVEPGAKENIKQVSITNTLGQLLYTANITNGNNKTLQLHLPAASGLYFIHLKTDASEYIGKVVRE